MQGERSPFAEVYKVLGELNSGRFKVTGSKLVVPVLKPININHCKTVPDPNERPFIEVMLHKVDGYWKILNPESYSL